LRTTVEGGEKAWIDGQADGLAGTGREIDFLKRSQPLWRLPTTGDWRRIDLRNIHAAALTDVSDCEFYADNTVGIRTRPRLAKLKARVRKTVAKGE
jgi:hypothetical protein